VDELLLDHRMNNYLAALGAMQPQEAMAA